MIFERGAESASQALSKWLGQEVRLSISEVEQVELDRGGRGAGPARDPGRRLRDGADRPRSAADPPGLRGPLGPRPGGPALAPADRHDHELGRARAIGRQETTNIVGCAYLNALAAHLPAGWAGVTRWRRRGARSSSPRRRRFLHEFAGSLLEFALMEQALELDQVLLVHTTFDGRAGRT